MLQITEEWDRDDEIEISEDENTTTDEESNIPDPYDFVYSNIPKKTHVEKCKKLQILQCKEIPV